ncbi:tRNA (adenosine(37)-N6)-threonylcarbamoyltransferase complex dimerization subunit type 1 TsaB [Parafrankia sp. EUN1f]|uniref:tRNA (adenosine(37)-N6)-threonylcarbamoyltransferase complex dimerization subunit type 1 TsaB n=1 Tax=Parafrankia sp. EUN1f TaxID=102897 RepID=UPI0001C462C1|nr:tRNA (adenosine(37)-N6)-threonylcarbamoyltransferase complex dimerization subunit type 1 TsaB [Parafrankia sp. EUN1f]EFC83145.1 peptidase M22 glycoprotease [Parafrankia sp. EUN1f]
MLVLALDTSTAACTVALVELGAPASAAVGSGPERVLAERSAWDARRHGELLAPMMSAVLTEAGVRPPDVAAVVVGVGPGPFTSLRVGMVTGSAFAAALGIPAHGVCSLDGIGLGTAGPVGVVTDARRREVFWARYQDGTRQGEPAVGAPAAVAADLLAAGVRRVVGPGVALYPEAFASFEPVTPLVGESGQPGQPGHAGPAGESICPAPPLLVRVAAAAILDGRAPGPLVPLYLRRPDAAEPRPPKSVTAATEAGAVAPAAAGATAG